MEIVDDNQLVALATTPKEHFESNDSHVVHCGPKRQGDLEKERKLMERIRELGLIESKLHIERQLMNRLQALMEQKDELCSILNEFRRKRPIKERINSTISEIRKLIHPSIIRDSAGRKVEYCVSVLMGYFTRNVMYQVDKKSKNVTIFGETHDGGEKLTKEVTLEFPRDVDMSRVDAQFSAGVFKVSIPFLGADNQQNASDAQSMMSSLETESLPSVDTMSVTSSDDMRDGLISPSSDQVSESSTTWV